MTQLSVPKGFARVDYFRELATGVAQADGSLVAERRQKGLSRLAAEGFPHGRVEAWRQSDPTKLLERDYQLAPALDADAANALVAASEVNDLGLPRLVFVNGRYAPDLSTARMPEGLYAGPLSGAPRRYAELVAERLGRLAQESGSAFAALADALLSDAALVVADEGAELDNPLHVAHVLSGGEPAHLAAPRTLVLLGAGSRLELVETYASAEAASLSVPVTEIALAEGARLGHYRLQALGESDSSEFGTLAVDAPARAEYLSTTLSFGGTMARVDVSGRLLGTSAHARFDGLYLPRGTQHIDHHTTIDHAVAECTSSETFKGVLADRSKAVFLGRINVRQDAQQTDARQSNANMLLSDDAIVHTRPQLEIYADDVKCAHGATIGRLDAEQLFYLRTRGLPFERARMLLLHAFANDVLEGIENEGLRERVAAIASKRLD